MLLRRDVLGHRLIDVERAHLIRAADLELESGTGDWVLTGVDTAAGRVTGWALAGCRAGTRRRSCSPRVG